MDRQQEIRRKIFSMGNSVLNNPDIRANRPIVFIRKVDSISNYSIPER
jgi:hypothetical protein